MIQSYLSKPAQNTLALITISLIGTLLVFLMHLGNTDSYLSENSLVKIVDYHTFESAFSRRPITTFLIEFLSTFCGISIGKAFVLVNFFLLALAGVLLGKLAWSSFSSKRIVFLTILLFYLSFSVLFAFFQPVYSYDEPIQYVLIFSALHFNLTKKWLFYSTAFFLAILARETTVLLAMGLLMISNFSFRKTFIIHIIPIMFYSGFVYFWIDASSVELSYRIQVFETLQKNVLNLRHGAVAFASVLLVPILLSYKLRNVISPLHNKIQTAFVLSIGINTLFVFLFANTYEARLFALPLAFFWPHAGYYILMLCQKFTVKKKYVFASFVLTALLVVFFLYDYLPPIGTGGNGLFQCYLACASFVAMLLIFSKEKAAH